VSQTDRSEELEGGRDGYECWKRWVWTWLTSN